MPRTALSSGPANSTTIARMWECRSTRRGSRPGGQRTASPAATRIRSSPTSDPAAALDHDEPGRVRVRVRLDRARRGRTPARTTTPRPSLWMTWPLTPSVPGGPSGRRWPTPKRRTSIGIGSTRGSAAALRLGGRSSAGSSSRVARTSSSCSSAARQPVLVGARGSAGTEEADPDERHRRPTISKITRTTMKSKTKSEAMISSPNSDETRPQQPLPQVEVRRVAVERPGPDVVEDHEDHRAGRATRPRAA